MRNRRAEFLGLIKSRIVEKLSTEDRWEFQAKLNIVKSLRHPRLVAKSRRAIEDFLAQLRVIAKSSPLKPGEGFLHFLYGFKSAEEFPYYAYIAIQSALEHNKNWRAVFVFVHEPNGFWWDNIKGDLILIKMTGFDYFKGSRFHHYAHKADVVRLLMIQELGGVYLDIDTITVKSFDDLLTHEFGMAVQGSVDNSIPGLCNAVMWGNKDSEFGRIWIDKYRFFNSRGRDDLWDFHSVKLPGILCGIYPDKITILNHRAFFYPLWPDMERIFFSEDGERFVPYFSTAYGFHLWNGSTEQTLRRIDPDWVAKSTSLYAHFARKVFCLPEKDVESFSYSTATHSISTEEGERMAYEDHLTDEVEPFH